MRSDIDGTRSNAKEDVMPHRNHMTRKPLFYAGVVLLSLVVAVGCAQAPESESAGKKMPPDHRPPLMWSMDANCLATVKGSL